MTRSLLRVLAGVALALPCSLPAQQQTAVPHVDQLQQRYGAVVVANLVEVRGEGGQPVPASWVFTSRDPVQNGSLTEYTVTNGEVVGAQRRRAPWREDRGAVGAERVRISPLRAFQIAEEMAVRAGVGYHSADFSLLGNGRTGNPEWQLTLRNDAGAEMGSLRISAVDGTVLDSVWPGAAANGAAAARGEESIGTEAGNVVRGVGRGVGSGIERFGRWLQGGE